jgi:hypothetical protein
MSTAFIFIGLFLTSTILVLLIAIIRSICDDRDEKYTKQIPHPGDRK